jgi:tetratricopeptide (TPR) repeat protein
MKGLKPVVIVAAMTFACLATNALADDVDDCNGDESDLVIKGCSVIISDSTTGKGNLEAAYVARGIAYDQIKDWDKALADLDKAVALDPKDETAIFNHGVVNEHRGDGEMAIKDYDKALSLKPRDAEAHFSRGNVYYDSEDLDSALKDYDAAVKLDPKHAGAMLGRGLTYEQLGKKENAVADLKKVMEMSEDEDILASATQSLDRLGVK